MSKKSLLIFCLTIFSFKAWPQTFSKTNSGIITDINSVRIEIQIFSPTIIRVLKSPAGASFQKKSLSVVAHPDEAKFTVTKNGTSLVLNTAALKVTLDSKTGKLQYYTVSGKLLMSEEDNGAEFSPVKDIDKDTYHIVQRFHLPAKDAIYGLGQHQEGIMNYRNKSVVLRQKNMEIAVPFMLSSGGYGLFWDNYAATTFKDQHSVTSFESVIGDVIDYYFINGANADGVIAGMRMLTGNAPMFPKWVFGFWQSRERYTSQKELTGVVKKYRELGVPLDGIVQDWQYWGQGNDVWNGVSFGNPLFPEPGQMADSVHQMNAHLIISVWPSFGKNTAIYKEMKEKGFLYNFKTWPETPAVQVYDAFNPAARDVYWKYINKNLFSTGIDGWWLDATEPEQPHIAQSDSAHTFLGSFKSVGNAFPLVTTGGVYEHQRHTNPDKRVFILTRSAFAGQQRYATMTWSGDINGTWEVMRNQISGGLNLSLSGIPYWNTDIGGFYSGVKYPKGIHDPAFHEIYTRWMEFAAFMPMFRSHGTNTPREIFQFGKKGDWAYDAQEKFIKLRYRLLPYIYSAAWQVTTGSSTIMRALVMDFAADTNVYNINNQYMFGKSILVAPVTDSLYTSRANGTATVDFSKIKTKEVYLPKGTNWINFWTGEVLKGGNRVTCNVPIDQIPLFIKSGSILPLGPVKQYALQRKPDTLELRVYPGANGTFTLYEDENDNYNYEKGKYSTIDMYWNDQQKMLTLHTRKGTFTGMLNNRLFKVVIVKKNNGTGLEDNENKENLVRYSGKRISVRL